MEFNLKVAGEACQDALTKGIIENLLKDSPVLQSLPFITIEGNTLTYWQEKVVAGLVAWRAPGANWTDPTSPAATQQTATIKILGGDMDFDNFTRRTRPRPEDYDAALVDMKSRAMRYEFDKSFLLGDSAVDANQFDGLYKLLKGTPWAATHPYVLEEIVVPTAGKENGFRYECTTAGTSGASEPAWPTTEGATKTDGTVTWTCRLGSHLGSGADGAALTLSRLEQLIDNVKGGPPHILLMSARTRRDLNKLVRASGAILQTKPGMFGEYLQIYNGITIGVSDWVRDDRLVGSNFDCSSIYAFQMGESAVSGISTPEMIDVERMGKLESKDAERIRVKWYVSIAVFSAPRATILSGVRPVA